MNVESLCCVPSTDIIYAHYTSIKNKINERKIKGWFHFYLLYYVFFNHSRPLVIETALLWVFIIYCSSLYLAAIYYLKTTFFKKKSYPPNQVEVTERGGCIIHVLIVPTMVLQSGLLDSLHCP